MSRIQGVKTRSHAIHSIVCVNGTHDDAGCFVCFASALLCVIYFVMFKITTCNVYVYYYIFFNRRKGKYSYYTINDGENRPLYLRVTVVPMNAPLRYSISLCRYYKRHLIRHLYNPNETVNIC